MTAVVVAAAAAAVVSVVIAVVIAPIKPTPHFHYIQKTNSLPEQSPLTHSLIHSLSHLRETTLMSCHVISSPTACPHPSPTNQYPRPAPVACHPLCVVQTRPTKAGGRGEDFLRQEESIEARATKCEKERERKDPENHGRTCRDRGVLLWMDRRGCVMPEATGTGR